MSSSTLSSAVATVVDDGTMSSSSHPRADGPSRRRRFTSEQKLEYLTGYERACEQGQGGAYLRREGLYSSLISEWRRLRDAGVLAGKEPGQAIGALSRDKQAELIQTGEGGQVRASEGNVRHVEVFPMGSVRTPIMRRPRPLPRDRRADAHYTLTRRSTLEESWLWAQEASSRVTR